MTDQKIKEFEEITKPLLKFLCENFNSHVTCIVTPGSAEILTGIMGFELNDFISD